MKEETLLILKHINSKIEEVKEKHNIDNGTCFVIPIGNCADYGYISHEMIKDILQTQQRIEKAIKYIHKNTSYISIECMEQGLLKRDLDKVIEILKGEKE